ASSIAHALRGVRRTPHLSCLLTRELHLRFHEGRPPHWPTRTFHVRRKHRICAQPLPLPGVVLPRSEVIQPGAQIEVLPTERKPLRQLVKRVRFVFPELAAREILLVLDQRLCVVSSVVRAAGVIE